MCEDLVAEEETSTLEIAAKLEMQKRIQSKYRATSLQRKNKDFIEKIKSLRQNPFRLRTRSQKTLGTSSPVHNNSRKRKGNRAKKRGNYDAFEESDDYQTITRPELTQSQEWR